MRIQWMVVSLCLLSPSAWALMSKHCKEPVYKDEYVRYVCWYSNTSMPTAYEYHLKEMKKKLPASVQPYVLAQLPRYGKQNINISPTETLVYDHYLSQYREEYQVLWKKQGKVVYRMEIGVTSPGFFERYNGAAIAEYVYY